MEQVKCSMWYFLSEERKKRRKTKNKARPMVKLTTSSDITASQGHSTLSTHEVESSEVISLAQGILFSVWALD